MSPKFNENIHFIGGVGVDELQSVCEEGHFFPSRSQRAVPSKNKVPEKAEETVVVFSLKG